MSKEGFKVFTCAICGEQVTRPKSYALPDGSRACRSHQEAQDGFKQREKIQESTKAKERELQEKKQFLKTPEGWKERIDWPKCHCWTCGTQGMSPQDVKFRMLVGLEKTMLLFKPEDFLTGKFFEDLKSACGVDSPLWLYAVTENIKGKILNRTKFEMRPVVSFAGYTQLCPKCAAELGMKRGNYEE